jgi:hypothetical protein
LNGMSLRDWFAGQALAALLAAPKEPHVTVSHSSMADRAYQVADAMLAARDAS